MVLIKAAFQDFSEAQATESGKTVVLEVGTGGSERPLITETAPAYNFLHQNRYVMILSGFSSSNLCQSVREDSALKFECDSFDVLIKSFVTFFTKFIYI